MAYITNSDIENRVGSAAYVQLADDDGDNIADVDVVDEVRLAAEGEVNSYLAQRYEVPVDLAVHPELADLLTSITLDLAEYRLHARRPPVGSDVLRKRAHAIELLSRIAEGRAALPAATPIAPNATRGSVSDTTGSLRVLSREELSDH